MKKIYYLQKHLVKIGDAIEHNGFKALVTEELIELNPELFKVEESIQPIYFKALKGIKPFTTGRVYKQVNSTGSPTTIKLIADDNEEWVIYNWQSVNESISCFELTTKAEWDKQELLDKAKRDYPAGTVFRSLLGNICTVKNKPCYNFGEYNIIIIDGIYVVYRNGRWAEVLPLKFTTEDGVDIYEDMKTYLVNPNNNDITSCHGIWSGNAKKKNHKYFYHKENALDYLEKHKEKTLEDYENKLLRTNINSINAREVCWFYNTLKGKEPKLYYTKILQLIADDLNDGRYIHIRGNTSYNLSNTRNVNVHCGDDEGCVYFKSRELAEKAKALLGDKINYLFN